MSPPSALPSAPPSATPSAPPSARLSIIVARAANGVIGRDNALPWHLPEDLAHFRRTTLGCPVIMGRLTWESIGRPLPGRTMIVVSSAAGRAQWPPGVLAATSLPGAIALAHAQVPGREVFVIGGARLFQEALLQADRVVLTKVEAEPDGDVRFPDLDPLQWQCECGERLLSSGGLHYRICELQRRRSPATQAIVPAGPAGPAA